jgi:hypothetical protein
MVSLQEADVECFLGDKKQGLPSCCFRITNASGSSIALKASSHLSRSKWVAVLKFLVRCTEQDFLASHKVFQTIAMDGLGSVDGFSCEELHHLSSKQLSLPTVLTGEDGTSLKSLSVSHAGTPGSVIFREPQYEVGQYDFSFGAGKAISFFCSTVLGTENTKQTSSKKLFDDDRLLIQSERDMSYPLEVAIPSCEEDEGVTYFNVQVTLHKDTDNEETNACWTVPRRYSIFHSFYETLVKTGLGRSLKQDFPQKTLVQSLLSKGALKKRQLQLEAVLQEIAGLFNRSELSTKVVWQLFSFLDMPEEYAQTDGDWNLDSLSPAKPPRPQKSSGVNEALHSVFTEESGLTSNSDASATPGTPPKTPPRSKQVLADVKSIALLLESANMGEQDRAVDELLDVAHSNENTRPRSHSSNQAKATMGKSSKEIKGIMTACGLDYSDCIEKTDLVDKLVGHLNLNVEYDRSQERLSSTTAGVKGFEDSSILSTGIQQQLHLILKSEVRYLAYASDQNVDNLSWQKVFNAEEDGWEAFNFHECVRAHQHSVLVIKTKSGMVIGSYSDLSWGGPKVEQVYSSQRSFLFVAQCGDDQEKTNEITRLSVGSSKRHQAVTHSAWTLAHHGSYDLLLHDCPNLRTDNWFKPGDVYFPLPSDSPAKLVGGENFQAAAIECYACIHASSQEKEGMGAGHCKTKKWSGN